MRFRDTPLADPKPGPALGQGGPETVAKWSQK